MDEGTQLNRIKISDVVIGGIGDFLVDLSILKHIMQSMFLVPKAKFYILIFRTVSNDI